MTTALKSALFAQPLLAGMALSAPAATLGDEGLHNGLWLRGCIRCRKMHEVVVSDPRIAQYVADNYFVNHINMFGDVAVTDAERIQLPEKEKASRWGALFTPTMIFLPERVPEGQTAAQASVATMPGAFGKGTTSALLEWVHDHGYESGENFQKYVAEKSKAAD